MSKASPRSGRSLRCAVYTRKSSEEGLEQEFNSLQAQREACEAFINSQRHEGWSCLLQGYDDGGRSGGNLERPALQLLLADIREGKVDVVVVYKIDRLTRSLADLAKIVEIFDAKAVSFVSVTQQFNTTTSMGRLTLNVLLSFAQFEREVTGERIRDKIAASKKKGMWMGGVPPLGYTVRDRKLIIVETEAETVRHIFRRYAALGSVRLLQQELETDGIAGKSWTSAAGRSWGGQPLGRGALYLISQNPISVDPDPVDDEPTLPLSHPVQLSRAGKEVRMVIDHTDPFAPPPKPGRALIRLVVRAHRFHDMLIKHKAGKFGDLAKSEKLNRSYFSRLLRLAYLAPDITAAILDGHQPAGLTTTTLVERADLPISWSEQRRTLGFA